MFEFQNEFQAAFDLSRREHVNADETQRAVDLTREGKFVVCVDYLVHCSFTDAVICGETMIVDIYDTREAALSALLEDEEGEGCPYLFTVYEAEERETTIDDSDIPF